MQVFHWKSNLTSTEHIKPDMDIITIFKLDAGLDCQIDD